MKRYQRKGFTLLELIIVIALFSIIMVSVVKLLDPVSKFFVRSSNFETTNACIDNMRRSIEGNLQYADRALLVEGKAPYKYELESGVLKSDYKPSDSLIEKVKAFYRDYFWERKFLDCIGTIYVLVFDNTEIVSDSNLKNFQILSDINAEKLNKGKMVRYEFTFDNYTDDPLTISPSATTPWYVNQSLYGNFEYQYSLASAVKDASGNVIFDPKDCTIAITMNEIRKSPEGLVRDSESKTNTATFSMKNVLDATNYYQTTMDDYIIKEVPENIDDPTKILDWFKRSDVGVARFKREPITEGAAAAADSFDGFYFIYTLPETTYDLTDMDLGEGKYKAEHYRDACQAAEEYLTAVKNKYP